MRKSGTHTKKCTLLSIHVESDITMLLSKSGAILCKKEILRGHEKSLSAVSLFPQSEYSE